MLQKAYWSNQLEDYAVDARCVCGHFQSEHGSKTVRCDDKLIREAGHGNCCKGRCRCKKFDWAGWVGAEEFLEKHPSKEQEIMNLIAQPACFS